MGENKAGDKLPSFIKLKDESGHENIHYYAGSDCPDVVKGYAETQLNETEENKRKGLEKLKAYMKTEENLSEIEDAYLLAVLRCCKYNIKKSEVKLNKFLHIRRKIIANLKKLSNEKLERLHSDGFSESLPWTDKEGRPIYIFRQNMNLNVYDYHEISTFIQASLICVAAHPLPTINGITIIIDCNTSPSVLFGLMNEYRKILGIERCLPLRIGRIDFVNENFILHNFFAFIRPFLPSKIADRVCFHGSDLTKLHKIYHPDLLPDDFGGTLGPVDTDLFKEVKFRIFNKLKTENFK